MSTPEPQPLDWNAFSPIAMWRDWVMRSEAQWSEWVGTVLKDARANSVFARQADELRMMQRMFGEMAQSSLAAANLPSRTDIESLDERLGRLEDGLAALAAEITGLRRQLAARPKPARSRRP